MGTSRGKSLGLTFCSVLLVSLGFPILSGVVAQFPPRGSSQDIEIGREQFPSFVRQERAQNAKLSTSNALDAVAHQLPGVSVQENSDLTDGPGIKAHWNLTNLIGSTTNAFGSVVADVDNDGEVEVIVSKDGQCEFYCLKQDGRVLWHTPFLSSHGPGYYGSEVVDIDGDGRQDFVAVADSIWVFDAATGVEKWRVAEVGSQPDEVPWILGHVNSADRWDIVIARTDGDTFVISVYDWNGNLVWSTAIEDATYGHTITAKDVDADGYDEVFVPCSKKTVALDDDGRIMWVAPLTSVITRLTNDFLHMHDLPLSDALDQVIGYWYHSDFAEVTELYLDGRYYVLHDYGGGVDDPTVVQVLDALTGEVVDSFESAGHHQWLKAADLRADSDGQEIVYVTREKVVMRSSALDIIWQKDLSGVHEVGLGDWDGDRTDDIVVSTIFRGLKRFAGVDSNFVVYNAFGDAIYNMLYRYPQGGGKYAGVQMQGAMKHIRDADGDGRVDVPVCFSNHDSGKFSSSQDVHQYVMSMTDTCYSNEFHEQGNDSTHAAVDAAFINDALQLSYLVPDEEYTDQQDVVLLMHMDEGSSSQVRDSSSHVNHGTLHNGEWVDQGRFGSAIRFDGQSTVVTVPYDESLNFDRVMVEVWLKASDSGTTQSVVERPGSFGLEITGDRYLRFYVRDTTAMRWSIVHVTTPFTMFDRFVHVMATYDGQFMRLMIDGEQVSVDSHSGVIDHSSSGTFGLYIGDDRSRAKPFQGIIDEIRISNECRALACRSSGVWVSDEIFSVEDRCGTLIVDHSLNGGIISYDILDESGVLVSGHTCVTSSVHSLGDLVGPIRVRANLTRGVNPYTSPEVYSIQITRASHVFYFPLTLKGSLGD